MKEDHHHLVARGAGRNYSPNSNIDGVPPEAMPGNTPLALASVEIQASAQPPETLEETLERKEPMPLKPKSKQVGWQKAGLQASVFSAFPLDVAPENWTA